MDNQIEISHSYFLKVSEIKNKNIKRHNKIKWYERVKKSIIEEPYHSEERLEAIESIDYQIKLIKDKINKATLIYSY